MNPQFLDRRRLAHPYTLTAKADRPSIIVFTMDMVSPDFYRAGGRCREACRRPAWDGLERDSVCFTNAFALNPLCGPSRAAWYTGRYPYVMVNEERAHDGSAFELRADDPTYPEYLKAAGYLCGHVGKSHIGTASFMRAFGESCSPWNRWAPPIHDDPDYHAYLRRLGIDGFRFEREIRGLKPDRKTPGNLYGGWLCRPNGEPFPQQGTYTQFQVDRALARLDSLLDRRAGKQPIYLHLDLFAPHQPFLIPAGFEDRERTLRRSLTLPEGYTAWRDNGFRAVDAEPHVYEQYRRDWGLYDDRTALDYLVAHTLQMEEIDAALGRLIAGLRERGLYDESLCVLAADHGEMNLERGLVDKGVYGHPNVARVPLLLKQTGNREGGRTIEQPVCLLDVAPTFLEAAGVSPAARLDGESLWRRLVPDDNGREEPFVFEMGWHVAPNPGAAVHLYDGPDRHYRYVYNACSPTDELYDLNDPQARNRIDDPALADVRRRLVRRMQEIFESDERWRCYRFAFELDHWEDLPTGEADRQMFIPE